LGDQVVRVFSLGLTPVDIVPELSDRFLSLSLSFTQGLMLGLTLGEDSVAFCLDGPHTEVIPSLRGQEEARLSGEELNRVPAHVLAGFICHEVGFEPEYERGEALQALLPLIRRHGVP